MNLSSIFFFIAGALAWLLSFVILQFSVLVTSPENKKEPENQKIEQVEKVSTSELETEIPEKK